MSYCPMKSLEYSCRSNLTSKFSFVFHAITGRCQFFTVLCEFEQVLIISAILIWNFSILKALSLKSSLTCLDMRNIFDNDVYSKIWNSDSVHYLTRARKALLFSNLVTSLIRGY